jgi:hypothetical protein
MRASAALTAALQTLIAMTGLRLRHGCLEWLEKVFLVQEHMENAGVEAYTTVDVLLGGLEPRVCLRPLVDEAQETTNDD